MRRTILATVAAAALLSACSRADEAGPTAEDVSESRSDLREAPDVSPTAAPGVAWRYSYDYQLADEAISGVQESHAAACEALGTARCRITGLEYSVREDKSVSASLEVKLAPEIARQFGKAATEQVKKADGNLLRTQFTGEDVTPVTSVAGRQQSDLEARIAALEAQLSNARSPEERAQLTAQLNDLRTQLPQAKGTIASATERLASTPMTFNYYGRGGIEGFRTNPVREAVRSFVASLVTMVTIVLQALAWLLPWALLIALLVLLARSRPGRAVRRFFKPRQTDETGG